MNAFLQLPPLSLYIHLPWCIRKCAYCDFNSHQHQAPIPERDYIDALIDDLVQELEFSQTRRIASVFFGGGTPSLFSATSISRLLTEIGHLVPFESGAEITLEANPGAIDTAKFKALKQSGVTRLSLGIQSFNDKHLNALGRIHNADEAIKAVELAHDAQFDSINLDLMYGLPGQTLSDAIRDVKTCISLGPQHVSYYQLTIEPNTFFHKFRPVLPKSEAIWEIQRAGQTLLENNGYHQYEISAYSKPTYRCRHNLNYWKFGDYLGIGAGAHGKITLSDSARILRYWKVKQPSNYMRYAHDKGRIGQKFTVNVKDLPFEFLMNHLRLREGFREKTFTSRTGLSLSVIEPALSECLNHQLLEEHGNKIRCTGTGWNFLDEVLQQFIPDQNKNLKLIRQ